MATAALRRLIAMLSAVSITSVGISLALVAPVPSAEQPASNAISEPYFGVLYLRVTPSKNDGSTVHRLTVKDVPVDGFWSISVYNAEGLFVKNPFDIYVLHNITAKKTADGSVAVQFGGCDGKITNCLPTMPGWNYVVRLYRPRAEILSGAWRFPEAQPVEAGPQALR